MKKKNLVNLLLITIVVMIATIANANTNSFKADIITTSTELKPGEEVNVTLKVSNINMGDDGINAIEGTIKYDTDVFEPLTQSSIISENGWITTYNGETNNSLNGKFLAVNLSAGTKENTKILTIKFKVKQDVAKTKETQIDIVDITSNDGVELVNIGTKNVKLNISTSEGQNNEIKRVAIILTIIIAISVIAIVCVNKENKYKNVK